MDASSPFFNYIQQNSWSSDSELYNISSPETISPSSYMDFSPLAQAQSISPKPEISSSSFQDGGRSRVGVRRTRCKNPSKQRQSASEKEKLRMRDLTKALNQLRTYLPPSVAPAGQTLTKIETLRLTIRYISYLSAQLGLSEESLCKMRDLRVSGYQEMTQNHCYSSAGFWGSCQNSCGPTESLLRRTDMDCQQVLMGMETPAYNDSFNSSSESLLESPLYADSALTYQGYNKGVHCSIAPEFWG